MRCEVVAAVVVVLLLIVIWMSGRRAAASGPPPAVEKKLAGVLRVATINLAHGCRSDYWSASERFARKNVAALADLVKGHSIDVLAAQEIDAPSAWGGGVDHVDALLEGTDLAYSEHGDFIDHGEGFYRYGTAVLSERPLRKTASYDFSESFGSELLGVPWVFRQGLSVAETDLGGMVVDVASIHLSFAPSGVRRANAVEAAEYLAARRAEHGNPLIVMGDMNAAPGTETMDILLERLKLTPCGDGTPTFPAENPRTAIDWVLLSRELECVHSHVLGDILSDHLVVLADVRPRRGFVTSLGSRSK